MVIHVVLVDSFVLFVQVRIIVFNVNLGLWLRLVLGLIVWLVQVGVRHVVINWHVMNVFGIGVLLITLVCLLTLTVHWYLTVNLVNILTIQLDVSFVTILIICHLIIHVYKDHLFCVNTQQDKVRINALINVALWLMLHRLF